MSGIKRACGHAGQELVSDPPLEVPALEVPALEVPALDPELPVFPAAGEAPAADDELPELPGPFDEPALSTPASEPLLEQPHTLKHSIASRYGFIELPLRFKPS